jgi:hypothetical protein
MPSVSATTNWQDACFAQETETGHLRDIIDKLIAKVGQLQRTISARVTDPPVALGEAFR